MKTLKRLLFEVNFRDGRKEKGVCDEVEYAFENKRIKKLIIKIMDCRERERLIFPIEKIMSYKLKLSNEEKFIVKVGEENWITRNF